MGGSLDVDLKQLVSSYLLPLGWKVLGALAIWIAGGWVIRFIAGLTNRGMTRHRIEPTLVRYTESALRVVLRIVLIIVVLSVFGIETTSFAAFLAAAGLAIGAAWSGLLANFAAGAFLVILKPFKVGDFIQAGGVTGTVREIGLFATTIDQPDNVRATVGNNKLFADNIVNFQSNPFRRVDLTAQLAHSVNVKDAIGRIKARLAAIPNVLESPPPDVEILEFNAAGTKLVVRPYCHNDHYWQVYFDTNQVLLAVGAEAGWAVPAPQQIVRQAT